MKNDRKDYLQPLRVIGHILRKEFLQIFRNRGMLPLIIVMPFIQLVILSNAATFDVAEVPFHLQDFDRSALSEQLVKRFTSTGYFRMTGESFRQQNGIDALVARKADMVLVIPRDFEKEMSGTGHGRIQLLINAEDGFTAGVVRAYANDIVAGFNRDLPRLLPHMTGLSVVQPVIDIRSSGWYNPEL
ncbi:MAG: ABC transporter permease, partial [Chlorobiaceae bacterium]|nr:ABC transporter permease [Chlorobiaceae bacterium]